MDYRDLYCTQIKAENKKGSGTASSYISALNFLDDILKRSPIHGISSFWGLDSADAVHALYQYALQNQKIEGGIFLDGTHPPSYGRGGYYSAALMSYCRFLVTHQYEQRLWDIYQNKKIKPDELGKRMAETDVGSAELLIEEPTLDLKSKEGKDAVREVKTRIGQDFFRKMILKQYNGQCCITGLNVPEVLRASHIVGWADDKENRLNPCNGLCLSATYDAAFDKYLISFDEDYRIILSPALRKYYTNSAFNTYFRCKEGEKITVPQRYAPDARLLEGHRTITMT